MHRVAERILPGQPISAVIDHLEHDPTRMIEGEDAFRAWLQDLIDQTIAEHGRRALRHPRRRSSAARR